MFILGIDTATDILGLAIVENGKMIIDYKIQKKDFTHSAMIILALKNILTMAGVSMERFDAIAVSIGPGSFTGLRIGLATAKGLVFALSIPIVGVNTLESYSFSQKLPPGILCPIVKARKGEYYYTLYQKKKRNDTLFRIAPFLCRDWSSIKEKILLLNQPVYIFGQGLQEIIDSDKNDKISGNIYCLFKEQEPPGAVNVALIGSERVNCQKVDNAATLSPFYIRKSAAEITIEKRVKKKKKIIYHEQKKRNEKHNHFRD